MLNAVCCTHVITSASNLYYPGIVPNCKHLLCKDVLLSFLLYFLTAVNCNFEVDEAERCLQTSSNVYSVHNGSHSLSRVKLTSHLTLLSRNTDHFYKRKHNEKQNKCFVTRVCQLRFNGKMMLYPARKAMYVLRNSVARSRNHFAVTT